jgi:hypothetical protein
MKKNFFIFGLILLLISVSCFTNPNAIKPDQPVGSQIYLPVINEGASNNHSEENSPSNQEGESPKETEHVIPIIESGIPTPTLAIEIQDSGNNSLIIPFKGLLQPPIPLGFTRTIDNSYRFGTTQEGTRIPHDGVEFYNPSGTPVLSAANGHVYFAGSDDQTIFGQFNNFYGNLIIIEHDVKWSDQSVFTVYAHLSVIYVKPGDIVKEGEIIGEVGATGSAIGSHLHFEVRIDGSNLENRLNPELFLTLLETQPETPSGILVGNILDNQQQKVPDNKFVIQPIVNGHIITEKAYYLETYAMNVPSDPNWQENFVLSNIPVGDYRLSTFINNQFLEKFITIKEKSMTFISLFPDK